MLDTSKYDAIEAAAKLRLEGERMARFTAAREAKDAFRLDLEREYIGDADVSAKRRDKLFSLAWEEGHSYGYHSVEQYYDQFVELVLPE